MLSNLGRKDDVHIVVAPKANAASKPTRTIALDLGVAPADSALYLADGPFTCADGSKSVDRAAVNDDFCDCGDGSDEPGTSACHGASKFFCAGEQNYLRSLEVSVSSHVSACLRTYTCHAFCCAVPFVIFFSRVFLFLLFFRYW